MVVQWQCRAGREAEDANLGDEQEQKARQHMLWDRISTSTTQPTIKLWLNSSLAYREIVALVLVYVHVGSVHERRHRHAGGGPLLMGLSHSSISTSATSSATAMMCDGNATAMVSEFL